MSDPPKVHRINDAVTYTNGVSNEPWFSYYSKFNPKISEMKSLLADFDVINGLHVGSMTDATIRVAMQTKVNPGSFSKVKLASHPLPR